MKKFILILFTFCSVIVNSQTTWTLSVSGIPLGYRTNDFTESPDGTIYLSSDIIESGYSVPKLLKSNNNGTSWTEVNVTGLPNAYYPNSIIFSGSKMLMAGYNNINSTGEVYSSNNYGQSWTLSNSGVPSGYGTENFTESPDGTIYLSSSVIGSYPAEPKLLKSNNNGTSWTEVNVSGLNSGFFAFSIIFSGSKMLMAGYNNMYSTCEVYSSNNYGQSWTLSNSGIPSGYGAEDLTESPDGTIYLSSSVIGSNPAEPKLLKSNNNGTSWTEVNTSGLNSGFFAFSIIFSGSKMLMAGYNNVYSTCEVYSSNYNSSYIYDSSIQNVHFKLVPNPTKGIFKLQKLTPNQIIISNIEITDINGSTVKKINVGLPNINISDLPNGIYLLSYDYLDHKKTLQIIKN